MSDDTTPAADERAAPPPEAQPVTVAAVPDGVDALPEPAAPGLADFLDEPEPAPALPRRRHHVSAVLVAHNGALWLPATLTTLAAQTRPPDAVAGVDTGSTDACAQILTDSLEADRVVLLAPDDGFGTAVAAGLRLIDESGHGAPDPATGPDAADAADPADAGDPTDLEDGPPMAWVWLLHDDSAPDPTCLQALLDTADDNPSVAVVGPKILGWHDRRLLLEVGVSIAGSGRRYTGLERREHDQGQHDGVRDVLAVSSAGMLVRRDVWDRLGGFDPELPLFRDDVDFCWRAHRAGERVVVGTDAVLHHREAGAHGRRRLDAAPDRPHQADRQAALQVLLAQAPAWRLPFAYVRHAVATLLRAVVYLVGKDVGAARDELAALGHVLAHPGRVTASRRRVAATATGPSSEQRSLRPGVGTLMRPALEALGGTLASGRPVDELAPGGALRAAAAGAVDDEALYYDEGPGFLQRTLRRPGVLLGLVLLVAAGVAARGLWWGDGQLLGGALLPSPIGAGDLWARYLEAWHEVGPGSPTPAPPYLAAVAALATVLLGKATLAVEAMLLLAVPLAGISAYVSLRGVVTSSVVKAWAAATYAILPAVTGAVAAGRLGTAALAVLLPPLARTLVRISGAGRGRLAPATARTAWGAALLVALATAFVPAVWLVVTVLAIASLVLGLRGRARVLHAAVVVLVPLALLLPWTGYLLANPSLFLLEPGLTGAGLTDRGLRAVDVLLLHPGGPGMTPIWLTVGVLLAALVALLRADRRGPVLAAWLVGGVALLLGLVQAFVLVTPPTAQDPVRAWPGPATLILGAALLVAAAVAADGLRAYVSTASFSWRQPVAGLVALVALAAPLASLGWWLPGAGQPLRRAEPTTVPAFVAAEAAGPGRPRTLVLRREAGGRVGYALVNGAAPLLGDAETAPPAQVWDDLDPIVAALASGRGGEEVVRLAEYGVRFVQVANPTGEVLATTLDSEPGLRRVSSAGGEALWRVAGVTTRARILAAAEAELAPGGTAETVPALSPDGRGPLVDAELPNGEPGRVLVIAETADPGWAATADGTVMAVAPADWAQAFTVPGGAPTVVVDYDDGPRSRWLWLQLTLLVVVVVLALPARRREVDPDAEDQQAAVPDELRGAGAAEATGDATVDADTHDETDAAADGAEPAEDREGMPS